MKEMIKIEVLWKRDNLITELYRNDCKFCKGLIKNCELKRYQVVADHLLSNYRAKSKR